MRKLPPLNAVRAFESAARHLSFTRAGEELNVTHGAISRQIQVLEAWLGVPLFRRLNRRVELTDAGQRYLSEIGVALDRISVASQSVRDRDAVRILRVNSIPTFTMRWLIPRLSTFQMRFPRVEVRLTTSIEEIEDLPDNFDVIIRGGPEIHAGFRSGRFLDESRFPVCSPALLKRAPLVAPSDLRRHTLLHSDTLPSIWPSWLVLAGVPNLRPAHALTFEHFYLSIQAAIDGLGVAMGPSALITEDLEEGRLVAPFPALALGRKADLGSTLAALTTGVFIACYTVCDGIGARMAGNANAYSAWLFMLDGLPMVLLYRIWKGPLNIDLRNTDTLKTFGGGVVSLVAYGIVIWAVTLAPMGPVSALRETSVVFAALLGRFFLKESLTARRLSACSVIAFGAYCLGHPA